MSCNSFLIAIYKKLKYGANKMAYSNPTPTVDDVITKPKHETGENDYYERKSVYFAFLDILGFKQAIDENRNRVAENDFAKRCRNVFVYYFELIRATGLLRPNAEDNCHAGQISDSLYFYTDSEHYLLEFLKVFAHLSLFAMTEDVFFRGGIAKGCLFHRASYQFYGDSVSHAYLLESEISKNPIIVIDDDTYDAIKELPDTQMLISKPLKGRYFLDPFAWLKCDFDMNIDKSLLKLIDKEKIQKVILKNKSKFEYDAKTYEKYFFLSECYSEFIKTLKDSNMEVPQC